LRGRNSFPGFVAHVYMEVVIRLHRLRPDLAAAVVVGPVTAVRIGAVAGAKVGDEGVQPRAAEVGGELFLYEPVVGAGCRVQVGVDRPGGLQVREDTAGLDVASGDVVASWREFPDAGIAARRVYLAGQSGFQKVSGRSRQDSSFVPVASWA
jgi:hypothetical protein